MSTNLLLIGALLFALHPASAGRSTGVPWVDTTKHSVPLDQIYFDTFQAVNRAVPLTRASSAMIARLRDAIPPIHTPRYEVAAAVGWLLDNDVVMGFATGGRAWAYPIRILNYHEIVNDILAGEPILVAYCPLCGSGVVFSRKLGDRVLTFGNTSALYESDMVMLDYETGSYWWHVAGRAIVGELTDTVLKVLPSMTTTWGEWRRAHPNTKVLSRETGYRRPYERDPFKGYVDLLNRGRFAFPVSDSARDGRLAPGTTVLAVKAGTSVRAYPLERVGPRVINDEFADQRVVVFIGAPGSGAVYAPNAGNRPLTFRVRNGQYRDEETGSAWNLAGLAMSGPLKGAALSALPSKTSFWFAIVAAEPAISVYLEQRQ
ncbi:MAG: DUF3179 domain-containing protein [Acidiferrobacterales bacterium]